MASFPRSILAASLRAAACGLALSLPLGLAVHAEEAPGRRQEDRPPSAARPDAEPPAIFLEPPGQRTAAERQRALTALYDQLASAKDAPTAERVAAAAQQLWQVSGSATVDLLMERASAAMAGDDKPLARALLDTVIKLEPGYAEGWNRRAALSYGENRLSETLADLARALSADARHFGALEGLAQTLRNLGQNDLALKAFRRLLAAYPANESAAKAVEELQRQVEGQKI